MRTGRPWGTGGFGTSKQDVALAACAAAFEVGPLSVDLRVAFREVVVQGNLADVVNLCYRAI